MFLWIAGALILVIGFIGIRGSIRNNNLRDVLSSCTTSRIFTADAYYRSYLSDDTVVLELQERSSKPVRRIDPVHLILEFSGKLDLNEIRRVQLARLGEKIFYIDASALRDLVANYRDGRINWAFNNLPERLRTLDGRQLYRGDTDASVQRTSNLPKDLNDFIKEWTGF
jgi:hypothetical protein